MTLSDIFKMACAFISEEDGADTEELRGRAPSLICAVVADLIPLDCAACGDYERDYPTSDTYRDLQMEFPLCDKLANLCAIKLGSLLCADENPSLSLRLNSEYELGRQRFYRSLRALNESIKNMYN